MFWRPALLYKRRHHLSYLHGFKMLSMFVCYELSNPCHSSFCQCVHNTTYFIVRDGINTGYRIRSYPVLYRILPYVTVFIGDPGKKYGIIPYPVLIRNTVFYRPVNTLVSASDAIIWGCEARREACVDHTNVVRYAVGQNV